MKIWPGLLVTLAFAGCATTKIINTWRDPKYQGPPFKHILVVGIGDNESTRRTFEDEFARHMRLSGVPAVAGYTLIPQAREADAAELKAAVAESQADAILITRLVHVAKRTQTYPGPVSVPHPAGYQGNVYGFYTSARTSLSPVAVEYEVVTLETNLWEVRQESLVWSATTETFSPDNVVKATAEFAQMVIQTLREQRLI
ncbi:MAG TPA: hypothetical protein VFU31_11740 [Candidatus Binatia bacterium]|nr:hypothetical protein [Candidatus Binatia bacterium]